VSAFSAKWLSLREPYDLAARNPAVLKAVADAFRGHAGIVLVDLACGAGATRRAIGAHLPERQTWRLVDNDLGLLGQAATVQYAPNVRFLARPMDLVRDLELALEGPLDLVTTSALLDLVSPEWLDRLVVEAAARRLPVYAALSYDGRVMAEPACCHDREIMAGFRAIQEELLTAWAELAALTTALSSDVIAQWLAQRRAHLAGGRSTLRVGHTDLFASPIGTR